MLPGLIRDPDLAGRLDVDAKAPLLGEAKDQGAVGALMVSSLRAFMTVARAMGHPRAPPSVTLPGEGELGEDGVDGPWSR